MSAIIGSGAQLSVEEIAIKAVDTLEQRKWLKIGVGYMDGIKRFAGLDDNTYVVRDGVISRIEELARQRGISMDKRFGYRTPMFGAETEELSFITFSVKREDGQSSLPWKRAYM